MSLSMKNIDQSTGEDQNENENEKPLGASTSGGPALGSSRMTSREDDLELKNPDRPVSLAQTLGTK